MAAENLRRYRARLGRAKRPRPTHSNGVQMARRKRSRIPARSMLRWLVDRKSAPLQTKSTPAALASRKRRDSSAA